MKNKEIDAFKRRDRIECAMIVILILMAGFVLIASIYQIKSEIELNKLSYRYDADGPLIVCDKSSNMCGLYQATKRIGVIDTTKEELKKLENIKEIPIVVTK